MSLSLQVGGRARAEREAQLRVGSGRKAGLLPTMSREAFSAMVALPEVEGAVDQGQLPRRQDETRPAPADRMRVTATSDPTRGVNMGLTGSFGLAYWPRGAGRRSLVVAVACVVATSSAPPAPAAYGDASGNACNLPSQHDTVQYQSFAIQNVSANSQGRSAPTA